MSTLTTAPVVVTVSPTPGSFTTAAVVVTVTSLSVSRLYYNNAGTITPEFLATLNVDTIELL